MDLSQQKEQFSEAYVRAVAAVAGYAVYRPEVDDDSVDLGLAARGGGGSRRSPRLEMQLKCTEQEVLQDDGLHWPLELKNYNDLRGGDLCVPRILVVVVVPQKLDDWICQSEVELAMRRCGYWLSLRDHPETDNKSSVTVVMPRGHVFSVEALCQLMQDVGYGGAP